MAKQTIITCDMCRQEGKQEVGHTTPPLVLYPRMKATTIDLCTDHHTSLVTPLIEALKRHGETYREEVDWNNLPDITKPKATPKPVEVTCVFCTKTFHSKTPYWGHFAPVHKTEAAGIYGDKCPLDGRTFNGLAAMGSHGKSVHSAQGVDQLFAIAIENKDPHGIVAERMKLAAEREGTA